MAVVGGIVFIIIGLFCGVILAVGSTGFWLWLFALGGEIFALFAIGCGFSENGSDSDSTYPKVLTVVGTALWGIALWLGFTDAEDTASALICMAGLFIAPYLIIVSLDAFFGDSVSAMVFIGIAKLSSSVLLYLGKLSSLPNEIPGKLTAYFVIVSLLALLSFILVILKPAVCAIGNLKEQRKIQKEKRQKQKIMQKEKSQKQKIIQEESKRKQIKEKYSYQLISAVEENNSKTVAALIEKGADVNYKDFTGKVPLSIAMENNNKNMISLLLEKGANIECEDNKGCTLLQSAVENGNVDMVTFLLEKGAFINCKDSSGQTPLLMALRYNNKNMISLLLEKGAAINIFDYHSKSALDFAIENEDADLVSLLLEKGADIGDSDSSLKTALDFAIKYDNADLLSRLAEKAAHENAYYEDKPILFFAIENNYKKLVELLIEKGADIECKGKYETTPLLAATSNGNLELVSLLLEKGANIECENEDGVTPLFAAIVKGNFDIISLLIERNANIEHEVKNTYTPLGCAVAYKHKEIVSFLIEKGANIEHAAKYGVTPLVQAINVEDKEIISILIEKGADVNHVSKLKDTETTPLFIAASGNNAEEIVSLLLENGANVNLATTNGFTVLQKAICDRNKKLVLLFLDAGAEINKNSNKIETALLDAVDTQNYDPEIVSLLIERGADVNLESAFNGFTPLTLAVSQNNKDAVSILLKNGADPNKKSGKLGTPLMIAFQAVNRELISLLMKNGADSSEIFIVASAMPKPEAAQFLLDNGADVNCEFSGQTPLRSAICLSTKEMVLFLISNGADVNYEISGNVSDKTGARTSLETAIVTGNAEMVSLLITYGADVNHKCKNGNTPLFFAARHQRTEIISILKDAGAISFVPAKSAQTASTAATNSVSSASSENSADFNAALVALSKIIAKNGADIFAPENSQKLKALVSDLIPQGNEIASKLKQGLSCDFVQTILDAMDKSDGKKEKSFKDAVDKIVIETGLEKETATSIVKLVALSLGWDLENLNLE